jgi:3-methyladenine DNA glycosylase AlkD
MHQGAADVLKWLEKRGSKRVVLGMARYGIPGDGAFGVPMGALLKLAKQLGTDHELSLALWESGRYEARLLAALVGDPRRVTRRQMDAWAAGFQNWGDCDTVCFKLFDKVPFAFEKAPRWAKSPREFVRRGAFVLMACLALHDKAAPDASFRAFLPLIEKGAADERNFVAKGVSWALRSIGGRSPALNAASTATAERLAKSQDAARRWVGKDALRELQSPELRVRFARRGAGARRQDKHR